MKKNIFKTGLLIFAAMLHLSLFAQKNRDLLTADYLYKHYAFNEAIEHYEKVSMDVNDPMILAKLGDCYRLTKNPERAADWYKEANKSKDCPALVKLHYAQTLMTLGRYEEAVPLLEEYQQKVPGDRRVENLLISCKKSTDLTEGIPAGTIYFQNFNTDGLEFGPAIRRGELVFTTDTVLSGTANKKDVWTGTPFYQMYSVDCNDNGSCDSELKRVSKKVNTKYHDGPCSFTQDGNIMYFTRTNYKKKMLGNTPIGDHNDIVHLQIMVASEYDHRSKDYKKIKPFHYNSDLHSTAHPAVSYDGRLLVFASDMSGGEGGTDLYYCTSDHKGRWSKPVNLGKAINTEGDEMFPFLDGDSVLYFASNGLVGFGGLDIYKATWNSATNTFSEPQNMGTPVNSSYDDMSYVLRDNNNAYFASNRPAAKRGDNIYSFHKKNIFLTIKAVDAVTGQALPSFVVELKSKIDERMFTANDQGAAEAQLFPQNYYTARINKVGYDPMQIDIATNDLYESTNIEKVVKMNPNFRINYHVVVVDQKTKRPIENPTLVFIENEGVKTDTVSLKTGYAYITELKPNRTYHIYGLKDNYYGSERYVSTKNMKSGVVSTAIYDTVFLNRLEVGGIYKIDNIYYDYDKATIREDAKPALDKILNVLEQYPNMRIQINSHTDCRGKEAYNFKLSNERAHSVVDYLIKKGVNLDRLQFKGFGKNNPINNCGCDNCSEEQHQDNRRTEFQIIAM
jgi:outer membrane protein OmpA-like peptidoglycan-associated protein/tetratricopeptide (TPR) repeat protein